MADLRRISRTPVRQPSERGSSTWCEPEHRRAHPARTTVEARGSWRRATRRSQRAAWLAPEGARQFSVHDLSVEAHTKLVFIAGNVNLESVDDCGPGAGHRVIHRNTFRVGQRRPTEELPAVRLDQDEVDV